LACGKKDDSELSEGVLGKLKQRLTLVVALVFLAIVCGIR
jgi:hypothetical protein